MSLARKPGETYEQWRERMRAERAAKRAHLPPAPPPVYLSRLPPDAEGYGAFGKRYHGD